MDGTGRATPWRRFLHRWAGTLPTRIICAGQPLGGGTQTPLFERSHVFSVRLPLIGVVTCYLHHYLRSDPDRGPHDHPWAWAVALPIAGGYCERRVVGLTMGLLLFKGCRRTPFVPYWLTGYDFHRVILGKGTTSWSLFFTGDNAFKPWGFLRPVADEICGQIPGVAYHVASNEDGNHTPWHRNAPVGRLLERAAP